MTQTTKRLIRQKAGQQIKKRVAVRVERRLQETAVSKVSAKAAETVAVVRADAERKLQRALKVKKAILRIIAVIAAVGAVLARLNKLYSLYPKLKNANETVARLTGIDPMSMLHS